MPSSHNSCDYRRPVLFLVAGAIAIALVLAACGGSDDDLTAAAAAANPLETNDGGVLVKPPDLLDDEPVAELPPLVEGLDATPIVPFDYFDGTASATTEFTGRPTVLNFWASNCAPCVAEMPEFEEVHLAFAGRVDIVGFNVADVSREAAVDLALQTGVTYPLADDTDSTVFRAFGGFVMPTTVFLNAQGQVAYAWFGVLTGDELTRLINEHILPE